MAIVICSAASEASGPTRPTITIEREDSSAITVPGVANAPTSATYTTSPAASTASDGRNDASTFAISSSAVVIGVVSNGSSVRPCFSPTTL